MQSGVLRNVTLAYCLLLNGVAEAQDRRWEVDFHIGGLTDGDAIAGTGTLPPVGPTIPSSVPAPAIASRRVSTWFFGDGPTLFRGATGRALESLDSVITSGSAVHRGGATVGVRLGRRVAQRWQIELSAEYGGRLEMSIDALRRLEAVRVSFESTFRSLLFPTMAESSAVAAVTDRGSRTMASTAAVTYDLFRYQNAVPFVTVGVGAVHRLGHNPDASIVGQYATRAVIGDPVSERDEIRLQYRSARHALASTAGVGVRVDISQRWLLRIDATGRFVRDELFVSVDTNASTRLSTAGNSIAYIAGTNPAIVFSNIPPLGPGAPGFPSSLSGPALQDFVTFSGRATQGRFSATAGLGFRF